MCEPCKRAEIIPDYPLYNAFCRSCQVRGLAQSPAFHQAERSMGVEAYQKAVKALFGTDWRAAHDEVVAEGERIRAYRLTTR